MGHVVNLPQKRPAPHLLQLRIELAWIKPAIWRRVIVPETITLPKLHQVIQASMGWLDCHLHEFEIAGERYGIPDPEFDFGEPIRSEKRVRLVTSLLGTTSFRYVYDFGDDWEHRIKVERRIAPEPLIDSAMCTAGANACPPEDVGGAPGYADFVEAMADPEHPEHDAMRQWHGQEFDPTTFDFVAVNLRLQNIKL